MFWKIPCYRKGIVVSIAVLISCGILCLEKTSLSALDIQSLKPFINYKKHAIQNSENSHSEQDDVTPGTTQVTNTTTLKKHNSTSIHPIIEDTQDLKYSHSRFVLSYSYWEQQTNALLNMWSFQKWANKSGRLKVVEPFAVESKLQLPGTVLYKHQFTNTLRFRDYFDLDYWTAETAKLGIEPLVPWDTFLKYANKKVILAIPAYGAVPPGILVDNEINKSKRCSFERDRISHNINSLFKFLHFKIIKIICFAISYKPKSAIPFKKFNSYLIPNNNATILFGYWCGIDSSRLPMSGDKTLGRVYGGVENVLSMVHPNPQIIIDSKKYVKTVLKADFREYTAILIRSARRYAEMVLRGRSANDVMNYLTKCVGKLNRILDKSGSASYFLSTDIGRFGDRTAYKLDDAKSARLLQQILQVLYGNKTIEVYENEFIRAANGVEDRGYLASVQKTIAENAKCLIVMGGFSTFQKSVVLHYQNNGQFNCVKYLCYEDPI